MLSPKLHNTDENEIDNMIMIMMMIMIMIMIINLNLK